MPDITEQRKNQIDDIVYRAGQGGVTVREIANEMNMKKTPYLYGLIDELVEAGIIERVVSTAKNGANMYIYYHTEP